METASKPFFSVLKGTPFWWSISVSINLIWGIFPLSSGLQKTLFWACVSYQVHFGLPPENGSVPNDFSSEKTWSIKIQWWDGAQIFPRTLNFWNWRVGSLGWGRLLVGILWVRRVRTVRNHSARTRNSHLLPAAHPRVNIVVAFPSRVTHHQCFFVLAKRNNFRIPNFFRALRARF